MSLVTGAESPAVPPMLALREFCEARGESVKAWRGDRHRYKDRFPKVAGWDGQTELYLESDLKAWRDARNERTVRRLNPAGRR